MEQKIGFCTSADGVSIAYATIRDGDLPVVYVNGWPTRLDTEWESEEPRALLEDLATGCTLIRYDMRGTGLSEQDVTDFSLPALVRDLEAVVDHLELEEFDLLSLGMLAGPVAMTLAASRPKQIRRLVLFGAFLQGDQLMSPEQRKAFIDYTGKFGLPFFEFTTSDMDIKVQRDIQNRLQEAGPHEVQGSLLKTYFAFDASGLLANLTMPTLIMHGREDNPLQQDRELAARLPNSTFVSVEGSGADPLAYRDSRVKEIHNFLGLQQPRQRAPADTLPEGMTAILFLDIADSTALTTKLGDAAYREMERELDTSLRSAIRDAGGTPVEGKVLGDGVMAVFTSARQAIDAAQRCRDLGNEAGLPLHLGIHAGDVVREGNNVHGGAVQVAARVQSVAAPGEILVSDIVPGLARTSAGVAFEDRGEHELKGIAEPQRLFAVRAE
ncbi:MAG: adenylate/guanylate cyclase domain-containing protein [Chloroflexi bacterium]|nr:adenylate/guanylate cyclase domain-containing protein [Chloroflexota bacterium]